MLASNGFHLMWCRAAKFTTQWNFAQLQRSKAILDIRTYTTLTLNTFGCNILQNFLAPFHFREASHRNAIETFPPNTVQSKSAPHCSCCLDSKREVQCSQAVWGPPSGSLSLHLLVSEQRWSWCLIHRTAVGFIWANTTQPEPQLPPQTDREPSTNIRDSATAERSFIG